MSASAAAAPDEAASAAAAPDEAASAAAAPSRPPLSTVTKHVSQVPIRLYMSTNNTSATKSESLFMSENGALVFKMEDTGGIIRESRTLKDGEGRVVLTAKKFALSLAKWSISSPSGRLLAKTRTVSGLAKYGIEVELPSSRVNPRFSVVPNLSNNQVVMFQNNSTAKDDNPTPMATATYGSNVVMGMISAAIQNWDYHIELDPGADAALVCCLLVIFTGLLEWNALGGAFGMMN